MTIDVPILKGIVMFDGEKLIGQLAIMEINGKRHWHSWNTNVSSIHALRSAKRFLKDEHDIYTANYVNRPIVDKFIKKLGFKEIMVSKGLRIFRKD